jgi:hypothetical protein
MPGRAFRSTERRNRLKARWMMRKSRLFPILLIVFTNLLGSGVIIPVLPLFAVKRLGATVLQASLSAG